MLQFCAFVFRLRYVYDFCFRWSRDGVDAKSSQEKFKFKSRGYLNKESLTLSSQNFWMMWARILFHVYMLYNAMINILGHAIKPRLLLLWCLSRAIWGTRKKKRTFQLLLGSLGHCFYGVLSIVCEHLMILLFTWFMDIWHQALISIICFHHKLYIHVLYS